MNLPACSSGLDCTINNWNIITQVHLSECCPLDDAPRRIYQPTDIVAFAEGRHHLREVPDHVILHVERCSLVLAAVLTAVSTIILLVGTCLVSCRTDVYPPYEIVSQTDVKNGLFITSCIQQTKADVNFNDHVYPDTFRET